MVMDDNDKELLIRLEMKMDTVIEKLKDIPLIEERVRGLEKNCGNYSNTISDMKDDIKALEAKSNTWSILNSVGVFIAGLLGFLGR